jgi:hypothetical protein
MLQRLLRPLSVALLIFSSAFLATLVAHGYSGSLTGAARAMSPTIQHTVLPVNCLSTPAFTSSYSKLSDFGTFTVASGESVVEVTFHGRIGVDSLTGTTGAVFELRVDDQPTTVGRARAIIRSAELPGAPGVHVSMTGVFPNLEAGDHTVSLWVRAGGSNNSGTGGRVDPGCWSSDHIVVREYAAFGTSFLPNVTR